MVTLRFEARKLYLDVLNVLANQQRAMRQHRPFIQDQDLCVTLTHNPPTACVDNPRPHKLTRYDQNPNP